MVTGHGKSAGHSKSIRVTAAHLAFQAILGFVGPYGHMIDSHQGDEFGRTLGPAPRSSSIGGNGAGDVAPNPLNRGGGRQVNF
jgi:hypothetical protein